MYTTLAFSGLRTPLAPAVPNSLQGPPWLLASQRGFLRVDLALVLELFHVRVNSHFKETQQMGNESSRHLPLNLFSKWTHAVCCLVSLKSVFQDLSLLFAFYREPVICTEDVHVHINYYSSLMKLVMITLLSFGEVYLENLMSDSYISSIEDQVQIK